MKGKTLVEVRERGWKGGDMREGLVIEGGGIKMRDK